MATYMSRPFTIQAEQYKAGWICKGVTIRPDGTAFCVTMHGQETEVVNGDWIIMEPNGVNFYPCKPEVFSEKYVQS